MRFPETAKEIERNESALLRVSVANPKMNYR